MDALLPTGGWPESALSEILIPSEGVGELQLLWPTLVRLTRSAERVVLVVEQTLPALKDARRLLTVFEGLDYRKDKLRLVINGYAKGALIRPEDVEKSVGLKVDRLVPVSEEAVLNAINRGDPLPRIAPRDPVSRALQQWVQELSPASVRPGKSWFATLTGGM